MAHVDQSPDNPIWNYTVMPVSLMSRLQVYSRILKRSQACRWKSMSFGIGLFSLAVAPLSDVMSAMIAVRMIQGALPSQMTNGQSAISAGDSAMRDSALRMGTLPNGMRYYIRKNTAPAKRAEFWLAVNVGSLQEDPDQQGFAHFLEHMAFNGTKHFPQQQLIDFVESSGMTFGADLNAYTTHDETVYTLALPTDDRKIVQNGLQILEDWANGGITIDSAEVVAERGVVLGEWRSRMGDTIQSNEIQRQMANLYGANSRYAQRLPIGLPELISSAQPAPLSRFYRDWYRPDLMAVIVVGDIDTKAIEQEIRTRFGKIPASKKPRQLTTVTPLAKPLSTVFRGRVNPTATVLWKVPPRAASAEAIVRQTLIEQLLLQQLQRTFLSLREQSRRPFIRAELGRRLISRSLGEYYGLSVLAFPDSLERGVTLALAEIERIAQHGIPISTLEQQKTVLLRQFQSAADAQIADPSNQMAQRYVAHFLRRDVPLLSAGQELALAKTILPSITPQTMATAAQFWRDTTTRSIEYHIPLFAPVRIPTVSMLEILMDSVATQPLSVISGSATTTAAGDASLIRTLPTAGRIVNEKRYSQAGITEWQLSNGARVLYKPTSFHPDELFIHAHSLGGFSLVHDTLFFTPSRMVASVMTQAAGLGTLNHDQVQDRLGTTALREFRVAINHTDEEISLGGSPKEAETLFQMLYLQFTAPKLDTATLSAWKRYGRFSVQGTNTNDELARQFSRGNPRLSPISPDLVELMNVEKAMAIYRNRFGDAGDFTFTIVGAATPEQVRPLVERYLASLPSSGKPEREQPKALPERAWSGLSRQTVTNPNLPPQRATSLLAFNGMFPTDPNQYLLEQQRLTTLTWVLRRRLRLDLRERMSATYGVGVSEVFYHTPKEHYQVVIQFDVAPDRVDETVTEMEHILQSVRDTGVMASELARVSMIQRRALETRLQDNRYWLSTIQSYDRLGIPFDRIPNPYVSSMTPDDIRQTARRYLPSDSFIQTIYLPRKEEKAGTDRANTGAPTTKGDSSDRTRP